LTREKYSGLEPPLAISIF